MVKYSPTLKAKIVSDYLNGDVPGAELARIYQLPSKQVKRMSRKGNCHDNAPIESFFHLYKTECLAGFPPCKDLDELRAVSLEYVNWFNHHRFSLKKSMSPREYREHALAA